MTWREAVLDSLDGLYEVAVLLFFRGLVQLVRLLEWLVDR